MTKPSYEERERAIEAGRLEDGRMQREIFELEAENLRVRGLLQRISEAWQELKFAGVGNDLHCTADRHYVSEIDDALAESADIGKLDRVDKKADV